MIKSLARKIIIITGLLVFSASFAFAGDSETSESTEPSTGDEISEVNSVLSIIARADTLFVQDWTEQETYTVCHTDGARLLIGISRCKLVEFLGEPDQVNEDGSEEWSIGKLKEIEMNPAPVMIFEFDEDGIIVEIYSRLGM